MADTKNDTQKADEAEAKRRAALTPAERDAEDLRNAEELQRAENARAAAGQIGQNGNLSRDALVRRIQAREKAERDKLATVEVTVAPGRTVILEPGASAPVHTGGMKIMVTPQEEATLRAAGHLVQDGVREAGPAGPKVYQEAGLLQGHAPGQGAKPASSGKSSK